MSTNSTCLIQFLICFNKFWNERSNILRFMVSHKVLSPLPVSHSDFFFLSRFSLWVAKRYIKWLITRQENTFFFIFIGNRLGNIIAQVTCTLNAVAKTKPRAAISWYRSIMTKTHVPSTECDFVDMM